MSKLEKFGLVTGIISLVADCIALLTFFSGIWNPTSSNSTPGELPLIYRGILALTIVYGWLSTSWALARKSFLAREDKPEKKFLITTLSATIGIGLIVLPFTMAWWAANAQGRMIEYQAKMDRINAIRATLTIQAFLAPIATGTPQTRAVHSPPSPVDEAIMMCAPFTHITLGVGIFLALTLLMPLVYPDMPTPPIIDGLFSE